MSERIILLAPDNSVLNSPWLQTRKPEERGYWQVRFDQEIRQIKHFGYYQEWEQIFPTDTYSSRKEQLEEVFSELGVKCDSSYNAREKTGQYCREFARERYIIHRETHKLPKPLALTAAFWDLTSRCYDHPCDPNNKGEEKPRVLIGSKTLLQETTAWYKSFTKTAKELGIPKKDWYQFLPLFAITHLKGRLMASEEVAKTEIAIGLAETSAMSFIIDKVPEETWQALMQITKENLPVIKNLLPHIGEIINEVKGVNIHDWLGEAKKLARASGLKPKEVPQYLPLLAFLSFPPLETIINKVQEIDQGLLQTRMTTAAAIESDDCLSGFLNECSPVDMYRCCRESTQDSTDCRMPNLGCDKPKHPGTSSCNCNMNADSTTWLYLLGGVALLGAGAIIALRAQGQNPLMDRSGKVVRFKDSDGNSYKVTEPTSACDRILGGDRVTPKYRLASLGSCFGEKGAYDEWDVASDNWRTAVVGSVVVAAVAAGATYLLGSDCS